MTPFESAPPLPGHHDAETRAVRMHLERALACLAAGDVVGARAAASMAATPAADDEIVVERDGRVYRRGGRSVSLQRRGNLRRILLALVDKRLRAPGQSLTRDEVLTAGWPGERMRADSGALRVYTTIRRLRQGGLGAALVTTDDGYLLDPRVSVRFVE
jgi:hypothetical protein